MHSFNWSRRIWVTAIALGLVFWIVDLGTGAAFAGRIYPGIKVAGVNLGGLTRSQAAQKLKSNLEQYQLNLKVAGKDYKIEPAQVGAKFDIESTVSQAYLVGRGGGGTVVGLVAGYSNRQVAYAYQIDRTVLEAFVGQVSQGVTVPAVDATVVVKNGTPEALPEKPGVHISKVALAKAVGEMVGDLQQQTVVIEPEIAQPAIKVADTQSAQADAARTIATSITLVYEGRSFRPSKTEIGTWLVFEKENGKLVMKVLDSKVKNYVQSVANQINVAPVNKKITIINGQSNVAREGSDGLAINQDGAFAAVLGATRSNQALNYTITASPVAFKTETNRLVALEYGRYIEISLGLQHLWVYDNHQVVYESPITSGAAGAGLGTVTGLFSIYYKTTNTWLNGRPYGYDYNVPVDYWMPFHKGYGLHDARWRSEFGGQDYYYGGSHGCVNMPLATAAWIYGWADIGTPVWVHN